MSAWQEFLSSRTPTSTADDAEQAALALPTAEAGDSILVDLSHYGLLSLEGEDAQTFLQGQVTNDVKLLNGSSHYSGYCSPKGRLLALFLAFAHDGKLWLQFDGGLTAAIAKRLRMYVLRSKVVITEHSAETLVRLGVAGQQAEAALRAQFTSIPETEYAVVSQDGLALIRLPGSLPRYEIIVPAAEAPALWDKLAATLKPATQADWDHREIHAGIPEIVSATQETWVPQMVNLDLLNGINFKKGCYTGQEIVARTHYLGKVKRRTHLAHLPLLAPIAAGSEIVDAAGNVAGQVVRSAANPDGGQDILAELRLESVEAGALSWQGMALQLLPMPYALEK